MAGALNPLRSICIGIDPKKDTWRVKVRVLRVWDMFPVGEPSKPYAIHVVLIDVEVVYHYCHLFEVSHVIVSTCI